VGRGLAIAAAGMVVSAVLAGCGGSDEEDGGAPFVGVILPDTKSSQRWTDVDPKNFEQAFARAGIPVSIQNAHGSAEVFRRIGTEMINAGARVLIITGPDVRAGGDVIALAHANQIPVIDYDRPTLEGGADYYVGFDPEQIGEILGYGLTRCIQLKRMGNPMVAALNGAPEDSNATLNKSGYDRILQDRIDDGAYMKGPDQYVPDWSGAAARGIFLQMLQQQPRINAVLAGNDDLAGAVVKVLRERGLNGRVPVTGQDATLEGLQNVLAGDQCMTVYKKIKPEAYTAANLAAKLYRGEKPQVGSVFKDPVSGATVPFASLPPMTIDAATVKDVVADGFVTKAALCTGKYVALCNKYGVK
jgi:D-xylose transport system substrate-binding protein